MKVKATFLRCIKSKKDGRYWGVFLVDGSDGFPDIQPVWVLLTDEDFDYLAGAQAFDVIELNARISGQRITYTIYRKEIKA